ncbi:unnamed protein product, partial [Owenia fusiformis]
KNEINSDPKVNSVLQRYGGYTSETTKSELDSYHDQNIEQNTHFHDQGKVGAQLGIIMNAITESISSIKQTTSPATLRKNNVDTVSKGNDTIHQTIDNTHKSDTSLLSNHSKPLVKRSDYYDYGNYDGPLYGTLRQQWTDYRDDVNVNNGDFPSSTNENDPFMGDNGLKAPSDEYHLPWIDLGQLLVDEDAVDVPTVNTNGNQELGNTHINRDNIEY